MLEGFGEIRLIPRNKISEEKWQLLEQNAKYPIFSSIWYLDTVSPEWQAFVLNDYELVLPILFKKKLGIKYALHPLLIRSFEILGQSNAKKSEFLKLILAQLDFYSVNLKDLSDSNLNEVYIENRSFQFLSFEENLAKTIANFSENTRRKIKQFDNSNAKIEEISDVNQLSELFKQEKGSQFGNFNRDTYQKLDNLVELSRKLNIGYLFAAKTENEILALGFFILYNNHLLYIKGVVTENGKKLGAMQAIFNFAISKFHDQTKGLDFGGSNEVGLANFNKRFGAEDRNYVVLKNNKTKFPFRKLINRKIGL
ncbi:MAG: hypothetical protein ACKO7P_07205 [Bacteroidota bacterium]